MEEEQKAFTEGEQSWPWNRANPYSEKRLAAAWDAGRLNAYTEAEWEYETERVALSPTKKGPA